MVFVIPPPKLLGNFFFHLPENEKFSSLIESWCGYIFRRATALWRNDRLIARLLDLGPSRLPERGWYPEHLFCPQYKRSSMGLTNCCLFGCWRKWSVVWFSNSHLYTNNNLRLFTWDDNVYRRKPWNFMRAMNVYFVDTPKWNSKFSNEIILSDENDRLSTLKSNTTHTHMDTCVWTTYTSVAWI